MFRFDWDMTKRRKAIAAATGAAIVLLWLWPPFFEFTRFGMLPQGHAFIFDAAPPWRIDCAQLLTEWVGVLIMGAILCFILE